MVFYLISEMGRKLFEGDIILPVCAADLNEHQQECRLGLKC